MNFPILELAGLNSLYGLAHILHDVNLELLRGEVVALLGRNGAGKSTCLKSIMGLVRPASGEVVFAGRRIERMSPFHIARLGLGWVPEERRIFSRLTVVENLEAGRQTPRADVPAWTVERVFELFPALAAVRGLPGGRMSGGEQQMLAIARTLMGNPSCILLDEPSEGLAPAIVEQLISVVTELKRAGVAMLLSEQNFRFASAVSDRACVIEKGHIRFDGTFQELTARQGVSSRYLQV